jgi:hypothetical protein
MPAQPSSIQSFGTPQVYTLKDGRAVEVRNGCVVDTRTRATLAGSREASDYLLAHAVLTPEQREWISYWGARVYGTMGVQPGYGAPGLGMPKQLNSKQREAAA